MRELGLVRVAEAHEERRIRGSGERGRVRLDAAPRCARIDADSERVFRGMDLDVNVVSGLVVPESGDEAECAAGRLHDHRGRRDVVHLLVLRRAERRAGRGHLGDVAEEVARDVEVVDELVLELSARRGDVRVGRRETVAAHHDKGVDGPELRARERLFRSPVPRVEAALEADLEPTLRLRDVRHDVLRLGDADRDRFLAERRDARVEAAADDRRVRVRRRDDHGRVDVLERRVDRVDRPRAHFTRYLLRARRIGVVDQEVVDVRQSAQCGRMRRPETTHAQQPDAHRPYLPRRDGR